MNKTMYSKIPGEFDGYDVSSGKYFSVENASGKACNVNGYIQFDLYNTTGKYVEKCYAKVELYNTFPFFSYNSIAYTSLKSYYLIVSIYSVIICHS